MKQILFFLSAFLARSIIKIKKPYIIGVTATAGKTTMTHFIALFLKNVYGEGAVAISPYSYNGEYGLPLAIIGVKNPDKNPFFWIYIFFVALYRLLGPYPKYLILEYGIDHPGEMDYMLSIAIPNIAVIGPISPNHMEQFGTFERYRAEKLKIAHKVDSVIAYADLKKYLSSEATYYSLGAMSDIDASHIVEHIDSIETIVHYRKKDIPVRAPLFGRYQLLNILPLFEIASLLHIPEDLLLNTLNTFSVGPGRSRLLKGIDNTVIIDGSYNGGFLSITEGLAALEYSAEENFCVLFLGDMRELGEMTVSMHQELAHFINTHFINTLPEIVLVGENMKRSLLPELDSRFSAVHFVSSRVAGDHIRKRLAAHSGEMKVVFVKGSQNTIFLEEGIKKFLDDQKDESLLCRQSSQWMKTKRYFFERLDGRNL